MKPRQIARNVAQVPPQQAGATMEAARRDTGRICPVRYHYGADALAAAACQHVPVLYVIGGLYGNTPALDALEQMARREQIAPTLCFNGDFNWFNIADHHFTEINQRVLGHDAIVGNVEAEFDAAADDAGCGCAYPAHVEAAAVERSNQIHQQLKATAQRHPALLQRLAALPMFARYQVGNCRVAVVHGDADNLSGWRFAVDTLAAAHTRPWLHRVFDQADVDLFASSHTCLPALLRMPLPAGGNACVVNNGAAGMPNFRDDLSGLCTRIGNTPSPHPALHETRIAGAFVALLPLRYDNTRWRDEFLTQWPIGSAAWRSYFERISSGPSFTAEQALFSA